MAANWQTTTTIIIVLLQIQALSSVKITATGAEGQTLTFRCDYPRHYQIKNKYFCLVENHVCSKTLIQTDSHQRVEKGRFSIYDNTSAAFFMVQVDKLTLEDRGTYWCGVDSPSASMHVSVVQMNVSKVNKLPQLPPSSSPIFPKDLTVDKLHLPIYLTAVMCVAAILCVCMFTLGLLLAVKQRRSGVPHRNRETSDYETMANTRAEPELHCSCSHPDCTELSTLPPPPPDFCPHLTPNQRESTVSLGPGDYVDVEGSVCQYQHLDLQQLEEHVYHSLNGNKGDKKDVPPGLNEQIST